MDRYVDKRNQRTAVFEDTMAWIRTNRKLAEAVADSQTRTILYKADEMPEFSAPENRTMEVTVSTERSFEAAMRLKRERTERKVAVLNFASATNPGGGVTRGSNAQEESLCRCSTLYPCLDTPYLRKEYYGFHRGRHDVRYTDACIYTPGILIVKTDTDMPERMEDTDWCKVDIISCAAPNLREKPYNSMNPGSGEAIKISEQELKVLHKKRARKILNVAIANGVASLVLGAFGCGAFQNPPEVVAETYREIFEEYQGFFDEVVFAVYCTPGHMENYRFFRDVIENR